MCIPDPGYPPNWQDDVLVSNAYGAWAGIVVIDSTGWDYWMGGNLCLRIWLADHPHGPWDSNAIPDIHVANYGLVLGEGDLGEEHQQMVNELVAGVGSSLETMKHSVYDSTSLTKEQILVLTYFSTVFYYAGEAGIPAQPYRFFACVGQEVIEQSEVDRVVANMSPRYNLAYMDTCFFGDEATDHNMFWNPDDPSTDTCFFGWDGFSSWTEGYKAYTLAFFESLANRNTAAKARDDGVAAADAKGEQIQNGMLFRDYENFRLHWPYLPPS